MQKLILGSRLLLLFIVAILIPSALAIAPNQYDDFEDGTTNGWGSGNPNPNPPVNVTTGGPTGTNDNYLLVTANGGAGAGSKLLVFNSSQWAGNYLSAGVQFVSMYIKNFSEAALSMRIVVRGAGGDFWSLTPISISGMSDWQPITFSLQSSDLTGGADLDATLSDVSSIRIIHSSGGGINGDVVDAQIGLDNISASTKPLPFMLSLTSLFEGFYDGSTFIADSASVQVRDASYPYSLADQQKIILNTSGQGTMTSTELENSISYYIVVKHRNSVETWSAAPQSFSFGISNYNFTSDSSAAFGNNLTKKGVKWCLFSGDVNQDGLIDLSDVSFTDVDNLNFVTGYTATDVNGDNLVDLSDLSIVDTNNLNFVAKIVP